MIWQFYSPGILLLIKGLSWLAACGCYNHPYAALDRILARLNSVSTLFFNKSLEMLDKKTEEHSLDCVVFDVAPSIPIITYSH